MEHQYARIELSDGTVLITDCGGSSREEIANSLKMHTFTQIGNVIVQSSCVMAVVFGNNFKKLEEVTYQ